MVTRRAVQVEIIPSPEHLIEEAQEDNNKHEVYMSYQKHQTGCGDRRTHKLSYILEGILAGASRGLNPTAQDTEAHQTYQKFGLAAKVTQNANLGYNNVW